MKKFEKTPYFINSRAFWIAVFFLLCYTDRDRKREHDLRETDLRTLRGRTVTAGRGKTFEPDSRSP